MPFNSIPYKRGSRSGISVSEWNQLIDVVSQYSESPFSMQMGSAAQRLLVNDEGPYIVGTASTAIPPWSVFSLKIESDSEVDPVKIEVEKTSVATLHRLYTNGASPIPENGQGQCWPINNYAVSRVAIDGDVPIVGQRCGPIDSFGVDARGFGLMCLAVDSEEDYAYVVKAPFDILLVKTTASVSTNSTSTSYEVYGGEFGSEVALSFPSVPSARNRGKTIESGEWAYLVWINHNWELVETVGYVSRRFKGTLASMLAQASSTASVTITHALDGGPLPETTGISASNILGWAAPANAAVLVSEDWSSGSLAYILDVVQHYECEDDE